MALRSTLNGGNPPESREDKYVLLPDKEAQKDPEHKASPLEQKIIDETLPKFIDQAPDHFYPATDIDSLVTLVENPKNKNSFLDNEPFILVERDPKCIEALIEKMVSEFKAKLLTEIPAEEKNQDYIDSCVLNFKKILEDTANADKEGIVLVNAKLVQSETYLREKVKNAAQKSLLAFVAVTASGATALNAACLGLFSVEDLWSKLSTLSPGTMTLSATCFTSSLVINSYLAYHLIPNAFRMFHEEMRPKEFTKHLARNLGVLLLATGAGAAASAIGFSSFLSFGTGWATFNAATNGFIFWVTRFYGLVNALNRFKKYNTHCFEPGTSSSRTFVDLLTHCTKECEEKLNTYLKVNNCELNEKTIITLLKEFDKNLLDDPKSVTDKTWAERLKETFNVLMALAGAISVAGIFGQKAAIGGEKLGIPFNRLPTDIRALVCTLFGIATPILYFGQILSLPEVISDAWSAIIDPHLSRGQQAWNGLKATLLLIFNGFASLSLYTLADSVIKQRDYFFTAVTPDGSGAAEIQKLGADIAGGAVNAKLTISPALPAPAKHHHDHAVTQDQAEEDDAVLTHSASSTHLSDIAETVSVAPSSQSADLDSYEVVTMEEEKQSTVDAIEEPEKVRITSVAEIRDYISRHTLLKMRPEEIVELNQLREELAASKKIVKEPEELKRIDSEKAKEAEALKTKQEKFERLHAKFQSSLNSVYEHHTHLFFNRAKNTVSQPNNAGAGPTAPLLVRGQSFV